MTNPSAPRLESPAILLSGQAGTKLHGIWALLDRAKYRVVMAESLEYSEIAIRERSFAVIIYALAGNSKAHIDASRFLREAKASRQSPILLIAPSGIDLSYAIGALGGLVDCVEEPLDQLVLTSKVKLFVEWANAQAQIQELKSRTQNELHDGLTGLPTKALYVDRANQAVRLAARSNTRVALGMMDLEAMRDARETLGPASYDELLRQVALRLSGSLRRSDTVARIDTDQFAVVLACDTRDGVQTVTERLERVMSEPFVIGDHRVTVGGGIGVALFPEHGREPDVLLACAKSAMAIAKQNSLGHLIYDPIEHAEDDYEVTNVLYESAELRIA
jgi:diguanylate cyclase (GGDEF)-like protein